MKTDMKVANNQNIEIVAFPRLNFGTFYPRSELKSCMWAFRMGMGALIGMGALGNVCKMPCLSIRPNLGLACEIHSFNNHLLMKVLPCGLKFELDIDS